MKELLINTDEPYRVLVGRGLLRDMGQWLRAAGAPAARALIVTDTHVGPLYAQTVADALSAGDCAADIFTVPAGEEYKTPETLISICRELARLEYTRRDLVVALGGGVVGDMAGFASAVYQRGMRFVQCPTTLLSAVDASVGGKTAVDLPEGKNMIGAFHQPSLVVCDTGTFATLPPQRMSDGAAEIIKHAAIADEALFAQMRSEDWQRTPDDIVARNVAIKRSFVIGDERDQGKRQMLNFGHTIGHAVEAWSGYTLSHGQSVAIGMVMEMRAARRLGLSGVHEAPMVEALRANHLPVSTEATPEVLLRYALHDKKRQQRQISLTVLREWGKAELVSVELDDFLRFIEAGGGA